MIDLTNHTQGKLVVLYRDDVKKHYWVCQCNCGKIWSVYQGDLRRKLTPIGSCRKCAIKFTTHKLTKTPEYSAWRAMFTRCKSIYRKYGREVYAGWKGRAGFTTWLQHIGKRPSPHHSVDRWLDRFGDYIPGNVRWATQTEQNRNRIDNVNVYLWGRMYTRCEACKLLNINQNSVRGRCSQNNESLEDAIIWVINRKNNKNKKAHV